MTSSPERPDLDVLDRRVTIDRRTILRLTTYTREVEAERDAYKRLLRELAEWAEDACEQGTGKKRSDDGWHHFISTWEEADDLLARVYSMLGEP